MALYSYLLLAKDAAVRFWDDKAPRLGAALAFYTALSLSPLLLLVVAIAALVFGREAATGALFEQLHDLIGPEGARMIETMLAQSSEPAQGIGATVIGLATLLIGATGVFAQLQDALNSIWHAPAPPPTAPDQGWMRAIWNVVKDRFLSFSMICGMGFLLLVSLVISAIMQAMRNYVLGDIPGNGLILQAIDFGVSLMLTLLLFAFLFRFLPAVSIAWSDVWVGAGITAGLFTIGKILIGIYLGNAAVGSTFGAAGSFVVLLLWIYYSSQIVLYGAELTRLYAERYGSGLGVREDTSSSEAMDHGSLGRRHAPAAL